MGLEVGRAREIVLGRVEGKLIRSDLVDTGSLRIDQLGMDAVGRPGGHLYARQRDQFEIATKSVEEWAESRTAIDLAWVRECPPANHEPAAGGATIAAP